MSELRLHFPQRQFQQMYLDEVLDVKQLVNYRTVRAQGVNPEGIRVYYDDTMRMAYLKVWWHVW